MSTLFPGSTEEVLRSPVGFSHDVREYERAVREAVSSGQLLTAVEMAREGLSRFDTSKLLQQQLTLALVQTGALDAAQAVLAELHKGTDDDEETLSLFGRVYKELWRRANTPEEAAAALEQSCKYYGQAFAKTEGYYPGINLAFTYAAMGERGKARDTARKVAKQCRAAMARTGDAPDGWLLATLGEALIHDDDTAEAGKYYGQAVAQFDGRWRDLASMRRQAREILQFHQVATEEKSGLGGMFRRRAREIFRPAVTPHDWLERWFKFPSVVVFCGHMIDAPGRTPPRFPPEREPAIRAEIGRQLKDVRAGYGYSSAACGGDILFCEALLEMGAKVNLVLPCPVDAFKLQSVSFAGPAWEERFHKVLGNASTLLIANASASAPTAADPASAMALTYSNRVLTGLAALQAQSLDVELQAIALWDGRPGDGHGGTASVVEEWQQRKIEPHVIRLESPEAGAAAPAAASPAPAGATPDVHQAIKAVVYAEVVNYKRITEQQIPAYVREFRQAVAAVLAALPQPPETAESLGGVHYFSCDDLEDAGLFALELRDRILQTKWAEHDLPADLGLRIVLHAGPVFSFDDPVLRRRTCAGSHVARGGRIGPVTPSGQIYVTQEFAALCGAEGISAFSFEFLGRLPTASLFENVPLYRLDRGKIRKPAAG